MPRDKLPRRPPPRTRTTPEGWIQFLDVPPGGFPRHSTLGCGPCMSKGYLVRQDLVRRRPYREALDGKRRGGFETLPPGEITVTELRCPRCGKLTARWEHPSVEY